MNQSERQLLENLFDALDRLFDRESKVVDIYSLFYASNLAMGETSPVVALGSYTRELNELSRSGKPEELQREEALKITNDLRGILNELLPV
jgi:hypothetical protein